MKVILLAGGLGTRISEETQVRPKPMIEIGGKPILWHIMKLYAHYGLTDFIVCLGFKGYLIKEYFANYCLHNSDVTFDLGRNTTTLYGAISDPWTVTLVETGMDTMTGGRLKRVARYIGDEPFCMTYGDGVADINIHELLDHHARSGLHATVTATQPPGRFGALAFGENNMVAGFQEKPMGDGGWINGGFFVLSPKVLDLIDGDSTVWEEHPMQQLAASGQLSAYKHAGFWQPMDTLRDKNHLENLWQSGHAPWKVWG
jgi:glucose-1-phosphate cytidylyltransferase